MSGIDALDCDMIATVDAGSIPLSIDLIDSIAVLETRHADYEHLRQVCGNTSPFALLEWHIAWCTHYLNLDPKVEDCLRVYLFRNSVGTCVGIVPLIWSRRHVGPLRIGTMDLLGADPSTTESRTPLVERGYENAVVVALRRRLAAEPGWDWISWRNLSGPLIEALAHRTRPRVDPEAPGYVLDLAPSWEEFRGGLKRNIRESLRHCYNSLKRDGRHFSLVIAVQPSAVDVAVERFVSLHAMRAEMPDTIEHPNHFESSVSRRFLHDVCQRLAARGAVRIFQLHVDGEIVAVRIGFVVGDGLFLYYSGFDPRWAKYSVMTTTVAEAIKYAISQRLRSVNLSRGTDTSKTRWGPRAIEYAGVQELRNRRLSRLLHAAYVQARSERGIQAWLSRRLKRARRSWQ